MKKLIKISLAIVLCMCVAAPASAQFRRAVVVGGLLTNLNFKQDLVTVDKAGGFQAGVISELMFPGIGFGFDLGLMYNMAGANVHLGEKKIWASQGYGTDRVMLHQFNIPFHLRFKWTRMSGLEDYVAPFVYGGPEFSINVAHTNCSAFQVPGGSLDLGVGGGFEILNRWQVSAQYTWGMTYALKTKLLTNYSARTRQWALRVAYFF